MVGGGVSRQRPTRICRKNRFSNTSMSCAHQDEMFCHVLLRRGIGEASTHTERPRIGCVRQQGR